MKRFLIGVAVGALGAYLATKLSDKETREEWCEDIEDATERAKEKLSMAIRNGRGKAMRTGVKVRQEYREGVRKVNETAGDVAERIADNLNEFSDKAKERANS